MKERDITELLVDLPWPTGGRYFRPFVVLPNRTLEAEPEGGESQAGYLVWLGVCVDIDEARKLAGLPRESVSDDQTTERFTNLPGHTYAMPGGEQATVFEAVPEIAGSHAELLIGRIIDGLYLWGVHNPILGSSR